MPLPNTILIGVQKAGTSSLYDWITQHPEVCGNVAVKDFPFFINNHLMHIILKQITLTLKW